MLDYETRPVVLVPYVASDDHNPSASGTGFVVVNLEDVNEAPIVTWPGEGSAPALSILEDSVVGAAVGRIVAIDPDNG